MSYFKTTKHFKASKMRKYIFTLLLLVSAIQMKAQLAMGKWRTHFSYNATNHITQSENTVFAISNGALFSANKEDENITTYSKLSRLNDVNAHWIDYNTKTKKLLIAYSNGNIDILSEAGIKNIPDLFNKPMSASKKINHSFFYNNTAYLSCSFGIIALNTERNEITDTYYIGPNGSELEIQNTIVLDGTIYALAPTAIYTAKANEPNLVNYQYWTTMSNIPGNGALKKVVDFNGQMVLHRDNKLYIYNTNTGWSNLASGVNVDKVFSSNNKLFVYTSPTQSYIINTNLNIEPFLNLGEVKDATYDSNTNLWWLAANDKGILAVENNQTQPKSYLPEGPKANTAWSMTFSGNKLFVVPGGRWLAQYGLTGEVMIFENEKWTNINTDTITTATGYKPLDFMAVAVDPKDDDHFFVSAYGRGLYEFKDNKFHKWFNTSNSPLETVVPSDPYNYTRIEGIIFDKDGNLLVVHSGTNKPIKIFGNSQWNELTYSEGRINILNEIIISNQNPNQKWINSPRYGAGIFVYDDKGTTLDQKGDDSKFFTSFNDTEGNSIAPAHFHCIAQDPNGVIWAGTSQGPLLFFNTSKVFEPGFTCTRIKIPRNDGTNLADYLLETEQIKAIAIDGANRKWLGTESSGIFLMSENGQETLRHFTTANSPLPSNNITSIKISPKTGEVFIGTSQGLISYQSDASIADSTFNDVHAYPNPVREDFAGQITITGLVTNTHVKITDINGNLIYQTKSNGSIATWDGKTSEGKKVKTGIYLAICANEDGTQSAITKIMVIN